MHEICVVQTWKRDELLYLCLEAIRREDQYIPICVFSDRGHVTPELLEMTGRTFHCGLQVQEDHQRFGNSWNVVQSLSWGTRKAAIVHSIEDDCIIHPGYFLWARGALASENVAAGNGRIPGDPLTTWYESPCASWNTDKLALCIDAVPPGYLDCGTREEMQAILDAAPLFAKSRYRYGSAEQDGFFLRCIEQYGWRTKFPPKSLASHIGAWGYNRPPGHEPPTGTFQERIQWCRDLLHNKQRRMELFGQRITEDEMAGML